MATTTQDTRFSTAALGSEQRSKDLLAAGKKLLATPSPSRQDRMKKEEPAFNQTGIDSPVSTPTPVNTPNLPTPAAPATNDAYFGSATQKVDSTRKSLEDVYKSETERIEKETKRTERDMENLSERQDILLTEDIQPLTKPFREELEKTERERLYVNQNFEANQKLTGELETLLTEGNELIKASKAQPLAQSILNKKTNKTLADVAARTGVIEAVMSARSNQIGEAYRLIDRSLDAITSDRKDQLNYYEAVYNFYENEKDEKGKKLINLDSEQSKFLEEKINLLKGDLQQAETNAQNIKNLMTDPETALFMANAGVTLNDSPEVISEKMAKQAAVEELQDFKNERISEGYTYLPAAKANTPGALSFDVNGQTLYFKAPKDSKRVSDETDGAAGSGDAFIQTLLDTEGGKSLTDTTIQKLDKGLTVLAQLGVLQANVEDVKTGPIVGAFRAANPWDTQAQTIKAQLNAIVPNLARGIYGEVGVLTDNDIATYSRTIPNLKSTEEVRNAILYITLDMIGKSVKNTLSVNAAAGRDVSGFVDIYTEMENAKNLILQSIPGTQIPKAFTGGNTLGSESNPVDPLGLFN
jgi:hypothetical protein